nr:unnamed protein product [Digitaria exilis]
MSAFWARASWSLQASLSLSSLVQQLTVQLLGVAVALLLGVVVLLVFSVVNVVDVELAVVVVVAPCRTLGSGSGSAWRRRSPRSSPWQQGGVVVARRSWLRVRVGLVVAPVRSSHPLLLLVAGVGVLGVVVVAGAEQLAVQLGTSSNSLWASAMAAPWASACVPGVVDIVVPGVSVARLLRLGVAAVELGPTLLLLGVVLSICGGAVLSVATAALLLLGSLPLLPDDGAAGGFVVCFGWKKEQGGGWMCGGGLEEEKERGKL